MKNSSRSIYVSVAFFLVFIVISCGTNGAKVQDEVDQNLVHTEIAATIYAEISVSETPKPELTKETSSIPTPSPELPTSTSPVTDSEIFQDKTEGVWLVGTEIGTGKWRAVGGDCYAVTYDNSNEQLDMSSGIGSIIILNSDAFSVQLVSYPEKCTWTYLEK